MRDKNGIKDIFVGKLRDLLSGIEKEFKGVRLVAVDSVEDEILFGGAYLDEQEAILDAAIESGEIKIGKDGVVVDSYPRT